MEGYRETVKQCLIFTFSNENGCLAFLAMKLLVLLSIVFALNSCNTSIGLYRDTKAGFLWTKGKIQGSGGGGDDGDLPVY